MKLPRELWIIILKWKTKFERSERYLENRYHLERSLQYPLVKKFRRDAFLKYLMFYPNNYLRVGIIYDLNGNIVQYYTSYYEEITDLIVILGHP